MNPSGKLGWRDLWPAGRPIIGMVHLAPLPGAPGWQGDWQAVLDRAITDAESLVDAPVDGLLVENYGDVPFHRSRVPAETVAAMTRAVSEIRRRVTLPVGVNVLRNDARAALAIAMAAGATFIRVNVHIGALLTDQGWIRGRAASTLRMRQRLGLRVAILADVAVKHSVLPPGFDVVAAAHETWERGLADALIVSGPATGRAPDPAALTAIRTSLPEAPLVIGSGVSSMNAAALLPLCDGVIAGSDLEQGGRAGGRVDPLRAKAFVDAAHSVS